MKAFWMAEFVAVGGKGYEHESHKEESSLPLGVLTFRLAVLVEASACPESSVASGQHTSFAIY